MSQTFLIIDDNAEHRHLYKLALEALIGRNVEVLEANNTTDGFNLIKENDLAAIVLDNQLPGGTGFRLLYDLHMEMPNHPPVIFMSASMTSELAKNAEVLGAAACLQKSDFNPVDVARMIEGMIDDGK